LPTGAFGEQWGRPWIACFCTVCLLFA